MSQPRPLRLPALLAVALLGASALAPGVSQAAMRCGTRLISEGDLAGELLHRCGEPTQVDRRSIWRPPVFWRGGRPFHVPGGDIEVQVEVWTYNLGRSRLMRRVTLEDGVVRKIETLGYGYP